MDGFTRYEWRWEKQRWWRQRRRGGWGIWLSRCFGLGCWDDLFHEVGVFCA